MRVRVEQSSCRGHGRCYALAPELFTPDTIGQSRTITPAVPRERERQARVAAANCPEGAVIVEEDS